MDFAKFLERAVKFLVKAIFVLMGVCLVLQIVVCWLSRIRLSSGETVEFWLALAAVSVTAYLICKHRRPREVRAPARHGSERTPLMPRRRGEA